MKPQSIASRFLLLLLAAPAWGQSPPLPAGGGVQRPLNLSLPRDVLSKQGSSIVVTESEDTATRNLRQEEGQKEAETRVERRPYGTGFEARQRGMPSDGNPGFASGGRGAAGGSGAGAAGGGGAGRGGGMGRGR